MLGKTIVNLTKGLRILEVGSILEILDVKFVQSVQDCFAEALGVALLSVSNGDWLTEPSNISRFCSEYTCRVKEAYGNCTSGHKRWEQIAKEKKVPVIFKCDVGLTNFVVPVMVEGEYIGSVMGGHFLVEPPDEEFFRQVARKLEIDEEKYVAASWGVNVIPEDRVKAIADLIFVVTNSFCAMAYVNAKLLGAGSDYKIKRNVFIEDWFVSNYMKNKAKKLITGREFQILKFIVLGKSNNEIAKELFLSVHTVKAHVSSILEKFGVEDRVQMAVKAVKEGIV